MRVNRHENVCEWERNDGGRERSISCLKSYSKWSTSRKTWRRKTCLVTKRWRRDIPTSPPVTYTWTHFRDLLLRISVTNRQKCLSMDNVPCEHWGVPSLTEVCEVVPWYSRPFHLPRPRPLLVHQSLRNKRMVENIFRCFIESNNLPQIRCTPEWFWLVIGQG